MQNKKEKNKTKKKKHSEISIVSNNRIVLDILLKKKKKEIYSRGRKLDQNSWRANTWRGGDIKKKEAELTESTFHPI